jgi:hypothetical protein
MDIPPPKGVEEAMPKIVIELPPVDTDDKVEVELTINGVKRKMTYRVELFDWKDYVQNGDDRVTCLRRMIDIYDKQWTLGQIGVPTETNIPIMFELTENA